jgi:hypothetical protein
MDGPSPPPNADEIRERVDEALQGLTLEPHETAEILAFVNSEISQLLTPETTYFVLGSYRNPYVRRVRIVENELNRRVAAYAFLMGDLPEIDLDRVPTFGIRFHLLAAYADYVVGVYEQDAGGEVTELGKISETPYFEKSYVLPRDYAWLTRDNISDENAVVAAAAAVHRNEDLDEAEMREEIASVVDSARENGVDVTRAGVMDAVRRRAQVDGPAPSYSWVHLNEFRLFELHDRCRPWSLAEEFRDAVGVVPGPRSHPDWEEGSYD